MELHSRLHSAGIAKILKWNYTVLVSTSWWDRHDWCMIWKMTTWYHWYSIWTDILFWQESSHAWLRLDWEFRWIWPLLPFSCSSYFALVFYSAARPVLNSILLKCEIFRRLGYIYLSIYLYFIIIWININHNSYMCNIMQKTKILMNQTWIFQLLVTMMSTCWSIYISWNFTACVYTLWRIRVPNFILCRC